MIIELSASYNLKILPGDNPYLFPLRHQGVRDVGTATITDTYIIFRTEGYFEHLMVYTISGEGWLRSDGQDRILREGQVWISPVGTPHQYGIFGKSWQVLWFALSPNNRWNIINDMGTVIRRTQLIDKLLFLFNTIFKSIKEEHFNSLNELEELCRLILVYLDRELSQKSIDPREREIKRNFQNLFMKVNLELDRDWDVEALQKIMPHHYALSYFVRLCKKYYGIPPMHVVRGLRMQRAWELICNTNLPVYEISEKVGYSNAYAFSTSFKKYWKISPRNARGIKQLPRGGTEISDYFIEK